MKKLFVLIGVLLIAAASLWLTARHEVASLALGDVRAEAGAAARGAAAFEGSAFGGISLDAMETHALPWKLVATALVLEAQSRDPALPANRETLTVILSGFGFLTDAEVANRPEGILPAAHDMPLGFTFGDLAPVGGAVVRVSNLGCTACHAGTTYDAEGMPVPERAWLGMPNTSLNLEAYTTSVFRALNHALEREEALFGMLDQLYPEMGWRERQTLGRLVMPLVRQRLGALEGAARPLPFPNGVPGSTNGVAALKFQFGLPLEGGGAGDAGIVSIPDLGDRYRRSSLLVDGAYAVPGAARQAAVAEADLSTAGRDNLAAITAFFTVPSMGVHPEKAITYLDETSDIFAFLEEAYQPQPFPGPVEPEAARRGAVLYAEDCSQCHGTYAWPGDRPRLVAFPNWLGDVGTDPLRAQAFTTALAERIEATVYKSRIAARHTGQYAAPPLTGLWASAPYLHNGSVPTLRALLSPEIRPVQFQLGGHALDFDAMGIRLAEDGAYPAGYTPFSVPVLFDTRALGQGNGGHTFGASLTPEERSALIAFLKLL